MKSRFSVALRSPALWPWLIIVPGAIFRLWGLTLSPFWYDEAFTRLLAGLPLGQMLVATAGDVHPPLYYVLVWGLSIAGNSPFTLRMFSAVFSIAALIVFWPLTGEMRLAKPARLIALAVMAFHPINIYYAQEARMYSLLEFLVIMQFLALLTEDWFILGFYTACALYTHNYALIYTGLIGFIGLLRLLAKPRPVYRAGDGELKGTGIPQLMISLAIPFVLWLPWAFVLFNQMAYVAAGYWIEPITAGNVLANVFHVLAGYNNPGWMLPATMFSLVAGLLILVIQGMKTRHLALLVLGFGPLAIAVVFSIVWKPMLLYRGLIPSIPPLAMLAGVVLASADLRGRLVGIALIIPLAVGTIWQVGATYAGQVKGTPLFNLPETSLPVVHLDDTTLVLAGRPGHDYLLDAGCPGEGGALTHLTRETIGFKTIRVDQLPDRFLFAGMVGPLTTGCHQQVFDQLTAKMKQVYRVDKPISAWGVWYADSNR